MPVCEVRHASLTTTMVGVGDYQHGWLGGRTHDFISPLGKLGNIAYVPAGPEGSRLWIGQSARRRYSRAPSFATALCTMHLRWTS